MLLEQAEPELHRVTSAQMPLRTGDAFHVRLASLPHALRPLESGGFSWQARFTTNFPLIIQSTLPVQGRVEVSPAPGADGNYLLGQVVEVRAIPAGSYRFAGWRGSVMNTNAVIQLTVTNAMHLEPLFLLRNDSPGNADPLPQGIGEVQAAASGGGTLWWKWTAPETRQVGILFNRNGLLHAQVHARPPGYRQSDSPSRHVERCPDFFRRGRNGIPPLDDAVFEGSQTFSFRWARPSVFEGTVLGEADLPVRGVAVNFTTPTFQSKYTVLSSTNTDGAGHFTLDTRLIDHPANHNRVLRFFAPAYRELLGTGPREHHWPGLPDEFPGPIEQSIRECPPARQHRLGPLGRLLLRERRAGRVAGHRHGLVPICAARRWDALLEWPERFSPASRQSVSWTVRKQSHGTNPPGGGGATILSWEKLDAG